MAAKVTITDRRKSEKITKEIRNIIRKACNATLKYENFTDKALVDVTIVTDDEIKSINNEFRDIDKSTDVLSFPLGENGVYDIDPVTGAKMLGDVVISMDHANVQAELYGHGIIREVAFLTVHSMLHLLGYDHVNNKTEEMDMRKRQDDVLELMGLAVENK